jgi:hypothetical protein
MQTNHQAGVFDAAFTDRSVAVQAMHQAGVFDATCKG